MALNTIKDRNIGKNKIEYFFGSDFEENLSKLDESVKTTENWNPDKHKDQTRSKIAMIFVWGYFGFLLLGLVWVPIYNIWSRTAIGNESLIINFKDSFLIISSAVGSSLGFVIGYYFKGAEKNT